MKTFGHTSHIFLLFMTTLCVSSGNARAAESSAPVKPSGIMDVSASGERPANPSPESHGFDPAPVVPVHSQPAARLVVDAPLPEQLADGYVVIRYRTENLRILPVYGPSALGVSPRIGHLHVTVDDLPWHWLDASGEPLSINGLSPGHHTVLIELEDPTHKVIDHANVQFEIPQRTALPSSK